MHWIGICLGLRVVAWRCPRLDMLELIVKGSSVCLFFGTFCSVWCELLQTRTIFEILSIPALSFFLLLQCNSYRYISAPKRLGSKNWMHGMDVHAAEVQATSKSVEK